MYYSSALRWPFGLQPSNERVASFWLFILPLGTGGMFTIPTNLSTLTLTLTLTVTNAYREPSGNGVVGVP